MNLIKVISTIKEESKPNTMANSSSTFVGIGPNSVKVFSNTPQPKVFILGSPIYFVGLIDNINTNKSTGILKNSSVC